MFFLRGNYHDIGGFFAKLSNYPNIVNIKGLNVTPNKKNVAYSIDASFIVSVFTYKQPTDEELTAQIEAKRIEMKDRNKKSRKKGGK